MEASWALLGGPLGPSWGPLSLGQPISPTDVCSLGARGPRALALRPCDWPRLHSTATRPLSDTTPSGGSGGGAFPLRKWNTYIWARAEMSADVAHLRDAAVGVGLNAPISSRPRAPEGAKTLVLLALAPPNAADVERLFPRANVFEGKSKT